MDDAALQGRLEPLAREVFEGFALRDVAVLPTVDHDGDPVISIEIKLASSAHKYRAEQVTELTRRTLAALRETNDARFPLVWVRYPSEDPEEDFYPDSNRKRSRG